jgi:hypothetical protein
VSEELYPDVTAGDPITDTAFNKLQDFARRGDRISGGAGIIRSQGHINADAVDIAEPQWLRANADIIPGDSTIALNATMLAQDRVHFRPVDAAEGKTVLLRTYLLPIRKNDVVVAVYSELVEAFIPFITDYTADLKVDGTTSISGIFSGHIQLPNNNTFDGSTAPPPAFNAGPNVYIQAMPPTMNPSTNDEIFAHYTGLYGISGDVRPLFRFC